MLQKTLGDLGIGRRDFIVVFGLLVNVFTWLVFLRAFIEQAILDNNITNTSAIWVAFYLSIIGFSIIGAVVSKRFSRGKFLQLWIIFGVIASLLPVLFNNFTVTNLAVVSAIFGASFGLGMPSCLAFFTETTKVENRGRTSAIILLFASLLSPLIAVSFEELSLLAISIICAVWRGTAIIIPILRPKGCDLVGKINTSFISIFKERTFILFFVAWLIFSVVDIMEGTLVLGYLDYNNKEEIIEIMYLIEPVIATFFILIAGIMCDWIGRKKIVLSGFVALGAAYAIIGFIPNSDISWYLYFVVDSAAWGIFYLTFVLVLWGDLAQFASKEKYYALGSIPFFISYIIPFLLPQIDFKNFPLYLVFSAAAFFLFVAILPLIFAPETLPEKKIELRRLRSFAEEAQKAKEKYERKIG